MPNTRDDQCKLAIHTFMKNTYNIEYNLIQTTTNKSTKLHCYDIKMPKRINIYDIDKHTKDRQQLPSQRVYETQDFTDDILNIDVTFNNYFLPYTMSINSQVVSSLQITMISIDNDNLIAHVQALYYKSHRPYLVDHIETVPTSVSVKPCLKYDIKTNQDDSISRWSYSMIAYVKKLENECNQLRKIDDINQDKIQKLNDAVTDTKCSLTVKYNYLKMLYDDQLQVTNLIEVDNCHYKRRYNSIKNDFEKTKIKLATSHRLTEVIKSLYANTNKNEDCPVCYESIDVDNLKIPICGHFICITCSDRCDQCPLCRVEY